MKNITIIGATGFGGLGLIEIILRHPEMQIKQLVARKDCGKNIADIFPHLKGYIDLEVQGVDEIDYSGIDLVFFSTPDRAGMTLIEEFNNRNIAVIDFSGDFRFNTPEDYALYADNKSMANTHATPHLLKQAIYGLPEKYATRIKEAKIVGNPGCFAISMILGLLPAIEAGIISSPTIICDGKTGVSGAGKNSGESNLYPQRHEDVNTYREGKHQHTVEVENILNTVSRQKKNILFIPQIVPVNRGILTTIYADISDRLKSSDVIDIYTEYYIEKPFITITDRSPHSAYVRGSNRCMIRPMVDERTGKLFITSVIDNLLKGQSGNAVQNANLMLGFNETTGLNVPAFYP